MNDRLDISMEMLSLGSRHPVTEVILELKKILSGLNFKFLNAPELDSEYHNFTVLNMHQYHPARSMHDTFYLENNKLLRTHTSNIQSRIKEFPCRVASIGKVYRSDNDSTHIPMFHQIECFIVEEHANLNKMKWTIKYILNQLFQDIELRFRSSYFPFTNPSFEVDLFWNNQWIEILGCGLIHRNIIDKMGFAFGIGIERMIMIRDNIYDIRLFYKNDQRWMSGE